MQPILAHYCHCTYSTPVSYSPAIFSENIACSHVRLWLSEFVPLLTITS
jgi:hypothetical protein